MRIILSYSVEKINWIGHILSTNCLLEHITETKLKGATKVTGRQGRRRKQILDYLTDAGNSKWEHYIAL